MGLFTRDVLTIVTYEVEGVTGPPPNESYGLW